MKKNNSAEALNKKAFKNQLLDQVKISADLEINTLIEVLKECRNSHIASIEYLDRVVNALKNNALLNDIQEKLKMEEGM